MDPNLYNFQHDLGKIIEFIWDEFQGVIWTFYGDVRHVTISNFLFILALIPAFLGFVIELLFSFILSVRTRQVKMFIPWRANSYRLAFGKSLSPAGHQIYTPTKKFVSDVKKLSKLDYNRPPLLSFSKRDLSIPQTKHSDMSIKYRSGNEIRSFRSRLQLIVRKFHGFKMFQLRFSGVFLKIFGKIHSKQKGGKD